MNVTIVSLNSQYVHSSLAPWCLLAGIKEYSALSHNVTIVEGTVNEPKEKTVERIKTTNADVIAFCCYIWNIERVYSVLKNLKQNKEFISVLGGPEVSYNISEVLENDNVDYLITGEGELPFALLLDSIENGEDKRNIKGVCFKNGQKTIENQPYFHGLKVPSPYTDEYFNAVNGRIAYLETSRGCPYNCAFCLSGKCTPTVFYDIEEAKQNIIRLANSGCRVIKTVDRTFNANKTRAAEIFKFICDNYGKSIPKGITTHFEIAGDILDDATIEILNNAPKGSIQLEIGMQSFNSKTLDAINRKTDTEKLKANILKLTSVKNIHIHIDLIAGLVFEDFKSFADSFNIGFNLGADMLQLGFLKLLHGAEMRENREKYPCKFDNKPPYEVTATPWLTKGEISLLKACETALDKLCNSGRFTRIVNYLFNELNLNPFETLTNFGLFCGKNSFSLLEYTDLIYRYFSCILDSEKLRELLLCDIFSHSAIEKVPDSLRREDNRLKSLKHYLSLTPPFNIKGIKRRTFILDCESCGAVIEYTAENTTENGYKITKIPFKCFL